MEFTWLIELALKLAMNKNVFYDDSKLQRYLSVEANTKLSRAGALVNWVLEETRVQRVMSLNPSATYWIYLL